MRHILTYLIILILFPLTLGLSGCGAQGSNETNDSSLIMRTYTVPEGRAEDLRMALNQVLGLDNYKHDVGRAAIAGPQQILVLAPAGMQDSIATSLQQILAKSSDTAKMPLLRLNAWIVDAYPGHGPADPFLKSIQPALEAFSQDMGPAHFVQAHYFTAVSDVGPHTLLMPLNGYHLSYTLAKSNGDLVFNFQYGQPANDKGGDVKLNGQVTVQLGQNLVLGLISERPAERSGIGLVRRLLVIRIAPANQG